MLPKTARSRASPLAYESTLLFGSLAAEQQRILFLALSDLLPLFTYHIPSLLLAPYSLIATV
jgi:hypothetical protein